MLDASAGSHFEQRNSLLKHQIRLKRGGKGREDPVRRAEQLCDRGGGFGASLSPCRKIKDKVLLLLMSASVLHLHL